jgi:rubredoxin
MNKPYTCHICGFTFDALTDEQKAVLNQAGSPIPKTIRAECPRCRTYQRGPVSKKVFVLDITGDATLVG